MFRLAKTSPLVLLVLALFFASLGEAVPQKKKGQGRQGRGQGQQGQSQAKASPDDPPVVTNGKDGGIIALKTFRSGGLDIRVKVSANREQFATTSGIDGAKGEQGQNGQLGLNVLLHGDGGQSFDALPNEGVRDNLVGVAMEAPNDARKWGGFDKGGVERVDGAEHSTAINDIITNQLSSMIDFNQSSTFFTGVSGGSLTLSGFFVPMFISNYPNSGVLFGCGGLAPKDGVLTAESKKALADTRLHFQSTKNELDSLKTLIPEAITFYEKTAQDIGLNQNQINALQTANSDPNGGHCAFDGKDFGSGVQLMSDNFDNVIRGNGQVDGIGNVNQGVLNVNVAQFFSAGGGGGAGGGAGGGGRGKAQGRNKKKN